MADGLIKLFMGTLKTGGPQGSIPGALLVLMYTNDLPGILMSNPKLFGSLLLIILDIN